MRKSLLLLVAFGLGGCRAIVGIQDLGLADGGKHDSGEPTDGEAADSSAPDTSSADSGSVDSGPDDSGNAGDANPYATCNGQPGEACPACCRMATGMDYGKLQGYARMTSCLCTSTATCSTDCATTICATPPSMNMPGMTCAMCVDMQLVSSAAACQSARSQCAGDTTCAAAVQCLAGCH